MRKQSGARRASFRGAATCVLAAALAAGASTASAQPKGSGAQAKSGGAQIVKKPAAPTEVTGTVLEIDKDDLVLDVGSDAGVTENETLDLWRPLKLKHPVTGKVFADRFKIGQIQIGQVRPTMSLAKASGTPSRTPSPGDVVLFQRSTAAPATATATPASAATAPRPGAIEEEPAAAPAPEDADAKNVTSMLEALRNQNIPTRVARYEEFLRAHPDSRFFTVVFEEAIALKRLLSPAAAAANVQPPKIQPFLVNRPGALDAVPGRPLRVALEITNADGALLQYRRKGETLFVPLPMKPIGKDYYAAVIPGERIQDRDLEVFVEATLGGVATVLAGSPGAPETIHVEASPRVSPPPSGRGSVSLLTDYADYNGFKGNDWASQTEATFGVRYKDLGIRAVRMGFGVYRGVGGTTAELDEQHLKGRLIGLTYGYVETEFGIHRLFSLSGRLAVGLLSDGVGGGGQILARIGNDLGTNLQLGGELLGGVGMRSIIELQLNTFPRFPILLRTEVTNQPAGQGPTGSQIGPGIAAGTSDVAGRGIVQLGFRVTPDFTIAVRGSFQGRNINHAGPGLGGFVGYTW